MQEGLSGTPELPGLMPGRSLIWAPDWDCSDARVLFDAASGDYWLLSPLASRIVESLRQCQRVGPAQDEAEDWLPTLERLRQVGLLRP